MKIVVSKHASLRREEISFGSYLRAFEQLSASQTYSHSPESTRKGEVQWEIHFDFIRWKHCDKRSGTKILQRENNSVGSYDSRISLLKSSLFIAFANVATDTVHLLFHSVLDLISGKTFVDKCFGWKLTAHRIDSASTRPYTSAFEYLCIYTPEDERVFLRRTCPMPATHRSPEYSRKLFVLKSDSCSPDEFDAAEMWLTANVFTPVVDTTFNQYARSIDIIRSGSNEQWGFFRFVQAIRIKSKRK